MFWVDFCLVMRDFGVGGGTFMADTIIRETVSVGFLVANF